jgi:hypothetical protein
METRLGDIIDDFCIKCKRLTNHQVVSILESQPAKVRCRTCYSDHDYRNEQAPPPKVDPRKAALFNEVLERANLPGAPAGVPVPAGEAAEEAGAGAAPAEAVMVPKPKRARKA